jgi:hypothetical protein
MQSHGNPNRNPRENQNRNAALQIGAGSYDDLIGTGPSGAKEGVLYSICSL